jgi:hypothetical protein
MLVTDRSISLEMNPNLSSQLSSSYLDCSAFAHPCMHEAGRCLCDTSRLRNFPTLSQWCSEFISYPHKPTAPWKVKYKYDMSCFSSWSFLLYLIEGRVVLYTLQNVTHRIEDFVQCLKSKAVALLHNLWERRVKLCALSDIAGLSIKCIGTFSDFCWGWGGGGWGEGLFPEVMIVVMS